MELFVRYTHGVHREQTRGAVHCVVLFPQKIIPPSPPSRVHLSWLICLGEQGSEEHNEVRDARCTYSRPDKNINLILSRFARITNSGQ